jgi:hypothetical protein
MVCPSRPKGESGENGVGVVRNEVMIDGMRQEGRESGREKGEVSGFV